MNLTTEMVQGLLSFITAAKILSAQVVVFIRLLGWPVHRTTETKDGPREDAFFLLAPVTPGELQLYQAGKHKTEQVRERECIGAGCTAMVQPAREVARKDEAIQMWKS